MDSAPIDIQKWLEVKKIFIKIHPLYHFLSSMRPKLSRKGILSYETYEEHWLATFYSMAFTLNTCHLHQNNKNETPEAQNFFCWIWVGLHMVVFYIWESQKNLETVILQRTGGRSGLQLPSHLIMRDVLNVKSVSLNHIKVISKLKEYQS